MFLSFFFYSLLLSLSISVLLQNSSWSPEEEEEEARPASVVDGARIAQGEKIHFGNVHFVHLVININVRRLLLSISWLSVSSRFEENGGKKRQDNTNNNIGDSLGNVWIHRPQLTIAHINDGG